CVVADLEDGGVVVLGGNETMPVVGRIDVHESGVSSSSKSLKDGFCRATILQKMQLGSVIFLSPLQERYLYWLTSEFEPRSFEIGPAFRDIANTSGMMATALRVFLTSSHPKMPNVILTPEEIADVGTYILSLRNHR